MYLLIKLNLISFSTVDIQNRYNGQFGDLEFHKYGVRFFNVDHSRSSNVMNSLRKRNSPIFPYATSECWQNKKH